MIIILGLALGIIIGLVIPYQVPAIITKYVSVAFLAGLDSVIGAMRAGLEGKFRLGVFVSGFFTNLLLASSLTWMGDCLGVEIYQAAIITFGMRVFINLGYIRRDLLKQGGSSPSPLDDIMQL